MSGLEAIQNRILSEARKKADQIIEQADEQSQEILAAANLELENLRTDSKAKAEEQAKALISRAQSSAAMESRRILLQARQDMIEEVIRRSLVTLGNLPPDDKLSIYKSLILSTGETAGEITLNRQDQDLAKQLLAELGGQFSLSVDIGTFTGGLMLKNDAIEDNMTFERMAAISRPHLIKLAAETLEEDL